MFTNLLAYLSFLSFTLATPQVSFPLVPTVTSATTPSLVSSSVPASPTTNCISDNFVSPWVINNLVIVSPPPGSNAYPKFVSFSFYDPNQDLVLQASCNGTVDKSGDTQLSNGGYVACSSWDVRFQLQDDESVLVERYYTDPCKGRPPWNGGIAFGQSNADFQVVSNEAGSMKFQQRMEMNVTRMT